jgi:hypothetical protein
MKPTLVLSLLLVSASAVCYPKTNSLHNQNAKEMRQHRSAQGDALSCWHAPCVLPNVLITANQSSNTIVAANPAKHAQLLAGVDSSYGGTCPFGSLDGGASWYQDQAGRCAGSTPSLAYGTKSTAYQVGGGYNSAIEITSTSDNGNAWTTPVIAVSQLFSYGSVETPWITIDNSSSSPYKGSLYVAATQLGNSSLDTEISLSYSRDGGNTWTIQPVDSIQVEPSVDHYSRVAVASDGTVYVTWQRCEMLGRNVNCGGTKAHMWLSKSTDGGNTWSTPVRVATVTLVPDSCHCAFFGNLPHTTDPVANPPLIAVDNSGGPNVGSVYVVIYNWVSQQMRLELYASRDGGSTWEKPVWVASPYTNDEFFPGLAVSETGVVGVSWLDRRNDPHDVFYQPFAAVSTDGGKSFGTNYQLARPRSNPYYSSYSMGDYTGNAWAGKTLFVTWPDTRNQAMQDYVGGLLTK